MVSLREARARDVVKVTKYLLPPQFVGVVAEDEGETIGIGLILWLNKRPFVTLDITDRLRAMPRLLHRVGVTLVKAGSQHCEELFVMEDSREPTANRWLSRLGFRDTGEIIAGERVLKWKPLQ